MIRLYFKKTPVPQRFYYQTDFHDRMQRVIFTLAFVGYPAYVLYNWEDFKPRTPEAPKFLLDNIIPEVNDEIK
uniref:Uncharacterized protein n=1 Tax=Acrobeloides nanus TaxID=290746 RepID=A0A914DV64_9BILA